jgi:small-conductance mechanosensitive channel
VNDQTAHGHACHDFSMVLQHIGPQAFLPSWLNPAGAGTSSTPGADAQTTAEPTEPSDPTEEVGNIFEETVPSSVEDIVTDAGPLWGLLLGILIALVVALAITVVSSMLMRQIFRKNPDATGAIRRTRGPLFVTLTLIGTWVSVDLALGDSGWFPALSFILLVAIVIGIAWWALRVVRIIEAVIMSRYPHEAGLEDRRSRRLQTQVSLIRRILFAAIITVAVAAVLLMVPQVRALGAGLLASAGVVSVVAGLAMQSTLTNVIAGIQLAFTDSIRAGDVVVVEGNFGSVEDITLSAVVLKSWDERRFIYPSSYFVATPFENWTRTGTAVMGTVELDLDWRVPADAMRGRLKRLLESTELWDGRDFSLQITDATGGFVQARVVVSARNSGELWDLRCLVREDLVNYLRSEHPYAVLTQRMLVTNEEALRGEPEDVSTGEFGRFDPENPEQPVTQAVEGSSMFTGSIAAVERGRDFTGPGEDAYRERRERQEGTEEQDPDAEPDADTDVRTDIDPSDDDETSTISSGPRR